jgi:hypothetical protein
MSNVQELAMAEWLRFRGLVIAECSRIGATIPIQIIPGENSLIVKRVEDGEALKVLRLQFEPTISRILWRCNNPFSKNGEFYLRPYGEVFLYMENATNIQLDEIVYRLTMCLTGQL